jgi:hypothetical protein
MKYKKVFMLPLAIELRKLGYRIVKIEPNYHSPDLDVYTFEVRDNFMEDFSRLSNEKPWKK